MCEFVDMLMSKTHSPHSQRTILLSAEANDNESFRQLCLLLVHDDGPHAQHAEQKSSTLMLEESGETSSRHSSILQKGFKMV